MDDSLSSAPFAEFLVEAKRRSYASGGAESSCAVVAVLPRSHQLEYRSGEFFYRDIYFGQRHFTGQEVVYLRERPVWSMCYSGGWTEELTDEGEIPSLAAVLQSALREIPLEAPFRGPQRYAVESYRYLNEASGDTRRFRGRERIERKGVVLYELSYSGGALD